MTKRNYNVQFTSFRLDVSGCPISSMRYEIIVNLLMCSTVNALINPLTRSLICNNRFKAFGISDVYIRYISEPR